MNQKRLLSAAIIGNLFEWFDYGLYGFNTTLFASLFFKGSGTVIATLAVLAIFAAGHIIRPLGGVVIGYIGDRYSVRVALILTLVLMGVNSLVIGILPGYGCIGIAAPIILLMMRLLQGFAVGGELPGSLIVLKNFNKKLPAFSTSLALLGSFAGILLAIAMVNILFHTLSKTQYESWGWRIPFILGVILVFIGGCLRFGLNHETAYTSKIPLVEIFKRYKKDILLLACLMVFPSFYSSFGLAYVMPYLMNSVKLTMSQAFLYGLFNVCINIIMFPLGAYLADKLNNYFRWVAIGSLISIVVGLPLFYIITHSYLWLVFAGLMLLSVVLSLVNSPIFYIITSYFPRDIRYSAIALVYGLPMSIVGGLLPIIMTFLSRYLGVYTPAWVMMTAALFTLIASRFVIKRHKPYDL